MHVWQMLHNVCLSQPRSSTHDHWYTDDASDDAIWLVTSDACRGVGKGPLFAFTSFLSFLWRRADSPCPGGATGVLSFDETDAKVLLNDGSDLYVADIFAYTLDMLPDGSIVRNNLEDPEGVPAPIEITAVRA